jgi:ABC-2 type transport system ATP-binding protein
MPPAPTPDENKRLVFRNLTKRLGKNLVLDDLSCELQGGITGILGTNGAGKTTLIRILAGLLPPDNGEVLLDNKVIDLQSRPWRDCIGYVPQSPGLYERMTVDEFLDYMLLLSGWKEREDRSKRVKETTTAFNLLAYRDIPLGHLSGGTKQRVAIAQAFVHSPSVLLLDEPTNSLDSEERNRFHNYLIGLSTHKTVLIIGHIINELYSVCSSLVILNKSRIPYHGSPDELISREKSNLREFTVTRDEYNKLLNAGVPVVGVRQHQGNELIVRCDARAEGIPGGDRVVPTLEEAYKLFLNTQRQK